MATIARNGLALLGATALLLPLTVVNARAPAAPPKRVMLCGWVQNPTPANWWLIDSLGEWTIMTQGDDNGPEGMDLIPDLTEREWVNTNGSYGYGCGCMSATVDPAEKKIMRIHSFKQKPLSACRNDPKLPDPEE